MTPTPTCDPIPRRARGPSRRGRRGLRRARGFTLVEILVVVGILLVLIGIAAVAFKGLDPSDKATKGTMQNLQGMLAEYEASAGLRTQPIRMFRNGSRVLPGSGTPPANVWDEPAQITSNNPQHNGNVADSQLARYGWDAVGNTQRVFQVLNRVPANKQSFGRLPARQVHGYADQVPPDATVLLPNSDEGAPAGASSDPRTIDPPLVLDAWGNPIIFVGRWGLAAVDLVRRPSTDGTDDAHFEQPNMRVTSVRTIRESEVPSGAAAAPLAGSRPFFASAGPDGNFRTGDDNLYSFQD